MEKYFGIFERIKNIYPDKIIEYPLYYKEAATLYDRIAVCYDDYPMFLKQGLLFNGPILELCCGSGRITLPLLKAGFRITAVDLSEDMLSNMRKTLDSNKRYSKVRDNLSIVNGDMTKLCLKDKYNLIIIGATSIRLMEEDFTLFFNHMYEFLNEGGCLFFNFEDLPILLDKQEQIEEMSAGDLLDKTNDLTILLLQRKINYYEKRAIVNFISMSSNTDKKVLLSHTNYRIFGVDDIVNAAEKSLFGACEIIPVANTNNYFCKLIK